MAQKGIDWSSLWKKEDWWSVWMGAVVIILAIGKAITKMPKIGKWIGDPLAALAPGTVPLIIMVGLVLLVLTLIVIAVMKENVKAYIAGFPIVFILCLLAMWLAPQKSLSAWGLEHVLWALIFGLIVSNIFGVPKWLKAAARTELINKIGLV
ncbi:MAG: putative sulfate exporter family transporter, partial [Deltaproteobacteria bacterium]|nr:putative sulfate exporter family transporter [Deltaproteobacteria bacterium]